MVLLLYRCLYRGLNFFGNTTVFHCGSDVVEVDGLLAVGFGVDWVGVVQF